MRDGESTPAASGADRLWLRHGVTLTVGVAWLTVVALVPFAAARVFGLDRSIDRALIALTLAPWVLLPAYLALIVGVTVRRWALSACAFVLVVVHLVVVVPEVRASGPQVDGQPLRVVTANLQAWNPTDDWPTVLDDLQPDVLVLQEFAPHHLETLERSGQLSGLSNRVLDPRRGMYGSAIFSRYRVTDPEILRLGDKPQTRGTIHVAGQTIDVISVHTTQPVGGADPLRTELSQLAELAHRSQTDLAIYAGDFNSSTMHTPFRDLLTHSDLRDAHGAVGRGLATTWPTNRRMPPLALLDHVLVPANVEVSAVSETRIPGSDHKAVVAELVLPRIGGR